MTTIDTTKTEKNGNEESRRRLWAMPPVDVLENEVELLVIADLPGVAREDIEIKFEEGELRLNASKAFRNSDLDYRRTLQVPVGVEADQISASLENGVLTLHLPKDDARKPRQIEIAS